MTSLLLFQPNGELTSKTTALMDFKILRINSPHSDFRITSHISEKTAPDIC